MKEQIVILSVGKPYDFKTDQGQELSGCTMMYLMTSMDGLTVPILNENESLGYTPMKESMPKEFYDRAKAQGIPCTADVEFGMKSSGGKTVLYIKGLDFVKSAAK